MKFFFILLFTFSCTSVVFAQIEDQFINSTKLEAVEGGFRKVLFPEGVRQKKFDKWVSKHSTYKVLDYKIWNKVQAGVSQPYVVSAIYLWKDHTPDATKLWDERETTVRRMLMGQASTLEGIAKIDRQQMRRDSLREIERAIVAARQKIIDDSIRIVNEEWRKAQNIQNAIKKRLLKIDTDVCSSYTVDVCSNGKYSVTIKNDCEVGLVTVVTYIVNEKEWGSKRNRKILAGSELKVCDCEALKPQIRVSTLNALSREIFTRNYIQASGYQTLVDAYKSIRWCYSCEGKGFHTCVHCQGSGYRIGQTCEYCRGGGGEDCSTCYDGLIGVR